MANLPGARVTSANGHYSLTLSDATGTSYLARARVNSSSPQTGDSRCQVLQVAITGGNIIYSSLARGNIANAAPDPCWAR